MKLLRLAGKAPCCSYPQLHRAGGEEEYSSNCCKHYEKQPEVVHYTEGINVGQVQPC